MRVGGVIAAIVLLASAQRGGGGARHSGRRKGAESVDGPASETGVDAEPGADAAPRARRARAAAEGPSGSASGSEAGAEAKPKRARAKRAAGAGGQRKASRPATAHDTPVAEKNVGERAGGTARRSPAGGSPTVRVGAYVKWLGIAVLVLGLLVLFSAPAVICWTLGVSIASAIVALFMARGKEVKDDHGQPDVLMVIDQRAIAAPAVVLPLVGLTLLAAGEPLGRNATMVAIGLLWGGGVLLAPSWTKQTRAPTSASRC